MAQQMLEWNSSTQYDTGTVSSFDLDNQGNCLETHVGAGSLYYRVGTINNSDRRIDFGTSTRYAGGTTTNISLISEGNFVEVHVSRNRLYSRVAQANFSSKTINWRDGRQYDEYDSGTYCDIAVDEQGNCLEVHVGGSGLYYRVGKVDFTSKKIDWKKSGTRFSRGYYRNCSVAIDNQGNCLVTYADKNNHLYSRVGKLNDSIVDWGGSSQYAPGYLSSVALDESGNCIATHVINNCLDYCQGTLNSESKTITWGETIRYSEDNSGRFSFTNVALDNQGNCFQTHVIPSSPNHLFYRWASLNVKEEWQQQLGSSNYDTANGLAVNLEGHVFATGTTLGQLGASSYGQADAWVAKFDSEANQQWIKQLGTGAWDSSKGIATDSQGNVYITGYTGGNLAGKEAQESDAWVMKLDAQGNEIWKKQFGGSDHDVSNAVAVDGQNNVYLAGYTLGGLSGNSKSAQASAWLTKLDAQGERVWLQELGTWGWTEASDVAVASDGMVYLTGSTNSNLLAQSDAWLAKYDADGNQKWVKHLCRAGESASNAIAVDSQDNIYLAGYIKELTGELISGWADVCVVKYDSNGYQQWFKSLGEVSEVDDAAHDIAVDPQGNVYVTGHTESTLGASNFGDNDAWVARFDPDGNQQWIKQIGTAANDYSFAIAVSSEQDVYLAGKTAGDLAATNNGNYDAWLARVNS